MQNAECRTRNGGGGHPHLSMSASAHAPLDPMGLRVAARLYAGFRIPHPSFRISETGFTLFEVVLAAAILALLMLGVLAATNGSFLADRAAGNATRSQAIARQTMEECLATDYNDLLNLNGNTATVQGFTVTITVMQSTVDTRLVEVVVDKAGAVGARTRLVALRSVR